MLLGLFALILGLILLLWSATGLAGLLSHGHWPDGVTFAHTPLALRHLITDPQDIPGAWPGTPPTALSGYGLMWGLFIGQLMVLFVFAIFAIGTVTRWRVQRRTGHEKPTPSPAPVPTDDTPKTPTAVQEAAVDSTPTPEPATPTQPATEPATAKTAIATATTATDEPATAPHATPPPETPAPSIPPQGPVIFGPAETRRPHAEEAVLDADGPVLLVTSDPALWAATKDTRAKLGPVLLYDPTHLCDTPARMQWSPGRGCEDRDTATARAHALLAPVRPTARLDAAVADTATTLMRCFLHAAAVDGRPFRTVHRWTQGKQIQDAVRALRTHPKAAAGTAGELEAALTAHPERRDMALELTSRALSALSTVHIRTSCTANRSDAVTLDSFVHEGGTLYVVGEPIEDPRARPGAMPLLTALASSVVEHGRRMAERSSSGRLDPPLTLILDDVAAVAPLPQLPELLADGATRGLPTLALLRSRTQLTTRWPAA
ncbi:type IV secretory system conjugative DNA transfer family protein [Streptomyces sp. NPDC058045]|uniref:type IV secretory system conjugative DNA transfer family protein n=1 Tax=Streptomyces sp. NPDC058045 TaxID=3346311 RepID=UPI0036E15855